MKPIIKRALGGILIVSAFIGLGYSGGGFAGAVNAAVFLAFVGAAVVGAFLLMGDHDPLS